MREHSKHRVDRRERCLQPPALLVDLEERTLNLESRETNRRSVGNGWRLRGDGDVAKMAVTTATMRRGRTRVRMRRVVWFTSVHSPVEGKRSLAEKRDDDRTAKTFTLS